MAYLTECHCPKCGKTYMGDGSKSIMKPCYDCQKIIDEENFQEWTKQFLYSYEDRSGNLREEFDKVKLLRYIYDIFMNYLIKNVLVINCIKGLYNDRFKRI